MVVSQSAINVFSNIWLSNWTDEDPDQVDNVYYLKIYAVLSLSYAFFAFGRATTATVQGYRFSKTIHIAMLKCLAHAPQC